MNSTVPPAEVEQAIKNILLDGQVFGVGTPVKAATWLDFAGRPVTMRA